MKVTIENYYRWTDDDDEERIDSERELIEKKLDPATMTDSRIFWIVFDGTFIAEFDDLDWAEIALTFFKSKEGRRKIEEVMTVRKLTEQN